MAGICHLEKSKNLPYLHKLFTDFDKIRPVSADIWKRMIMSNNGDVSGPSAPTKLLKFKKKNPPSWMPNFIKICHMVAELWWFFLLMAALCHLGFSNYGMFISCSCAESTQAHCYAKFHQNRLKNCRDMAILQLHILLYMHENKNYDISATVWSIW